MPSLVTYAIPAFLALLALEMWWSRKRALGLYETRDTAASLTMGLGNELLLVATKSAVFGVYWALWTLSPLELPLAWWVWPLAILGDDFCYYWFHRAHHEVRCLWAAHVNHHSSQRFNLATALRQSWTTPFTAPLFWAPLALLGIHPLMIMTAQAVSLLYQFWIHTELIDRLGPLEWVLNTPSHHRVHHGANAQYLDRNYGGILIVWDRLFGSFEPEGEKVRYGITHQLETFNPIRIAFHEWADIVRDVAGARTWRERAGFVFGPPGWSPEAGVGTSALLRRDWSSASASGPS
jgi:sterol desaturase/sphingolipid hydroxylase (fatty acid hydroxylase superfamily)